MKKIALAMVIASSMIIAVSAQDFGSAGALDQDSYTLEEMLKYGLEDEHMALAEYKTIMEEWNITRPYANIARSEETHISYLEELYNSYGIDIPEVDTTGKELLPESLSEAAEIGVEAEIANIAMYEKFLDQDLPDDVEEVFILLKKASENHLAAFENQLDNTIARGGNSRRGLGRR